MNDFVKNAIQQEIEDAERYREQGIASHQDNKSMVSLFKDDYNTRMSAVNAAQRGDFVGAQNILNHMEPTVYDSVTRKFKKMVERQAMESAKVADSPSGEETRSLQELNHTIAEAYVEGMSALENAKKNMPAGTYRMLKAALSKSYQAGRSVVRRSS